MVTSASNHVPSLAQIMACVQQVEGELEVTVGNESTETMNIGDSQTTIATQQLSDVKAYNKDTAQTDVLSIVGGSLAGVGSSLGIGCGMSVGTSSGLQVASTAVSVSSQAAGGSVDIVQAKFAEDQGDLSAQQQFYTGSSSTLGSVATNDQTVGGEVIQQVTTITADINGMLAQENQASTYRG